MTPERKAYDAGVSDGRTDGAHTDSILGSLEIKALAYDSFWSRIDLHHRDNVGDEYVKGYVYGFTRGQEDAGL